MKFTRAQWNSVLKRKGIDPAAFPDPPGGFLEDERASTTTQENTHDVDIHTDNSVSASTAGAGAAPTTDHEQKLGSGKERDRSDTLEQRVTREEPQQSAVRPPHIGKWYSDVQHAGPYACEGHSVATTCAIVFGDLAARYGNEHMNHLQHSAVMHVILFHGFSSLAEYHKRSRYATAVPHLLQGSQAGTIYARALALSSYLESCIAHVCDANEFQVHDENAPSLANLTLDRYCSLYSVDDTDLAALSSSVALFEHTNGAVSERSALERESLQVDVALLCVLKQNIAMRLVPYSAMIGCHRDRSELRKQVVARCTILRELCTLLHVDNIIVQSIYDACEYVLHCTKEAWSHAHAAAHDVNSSMDYVLSLHA